MHKRLVTRTWVSSALGDLEHAGGLKRSSSVIFSNVTILTVRPAHKDDLLAIEELVAGMFRALGTATQPATWSIEIQEVLAARLGRDVVAYVVVDSSDRPVSAAVGVVDQRLPSPRRLTGQIGYVEWLVTHVQYRRRGAARMALGELLDWFDSRGIEVVDVHASDAAADLYAEFNFKAPSAKPLRRRRPVAKAQPLSSR